MTKQKHVYRNICIFTKNENKQTKKNPTLNISPWLKALQIELRCILFALIILRCV